MILSMFSTSVAFLFILHDYQGCSNITSYPAVISKTLTRDILERPDLDCDPPMRKHSSIIVL